MSHLILTGLRVRGRVGCQDSERAHPQMLKVDVKIHYDMRDAITTDDIAKGIDYKGVAGCIRELVVSREWRLLETLAHDITVQLRRLSDNITRIEAAVTKDVIADATSVTVVLEYDY